MKEELVNRFILGYKLSLLLFSVIVLFSSSVMAADVVPFTLGKQGSATAQWTTVEKYSGSYSVNLNTTINGDYAYMWFDPIPPIIDGITSLSFYYYHNSYNTWPGPRISILLQLSGQYYLAISGTAASSIGAWAKADGITGSNIISYGPNPDDIWWYGDCNDAQCLIYTQQGGPVNFSTIQSNYVGASIESIGVYMGVVDGVNVSTGEAYIDHPEINGATYYGKIQDAIDSTNAGDTINVADGTYNEDLTINKPIEIIGSGSTNTTTISGKHTINSSNVTMRDFILVSGSSETTITIDTSSSAIDNIEISNCVFNINKSPSVGIYLGGNVNKVSNIKINNNTFNGPSDKICNPWKIGGWFGNPINCEVDGVDFEHNEVNGCSIPINLDDNPIKDILVNNNTFRNTDGALYVWGEGSPEGVLSEFVFENNDLDSSNSYGVGIDVFGVFNDSNFGDGNTINHNNFVGIPGAYGFGGVSILSSLTSYILNATFNWWGACDGPGYVGPGHGSNVSLNVDYTPWIGVCITNKTNVTCKYETDNVTLSASVSSSLDIDSVWVSYTINSSNYNETVTTHVGDIYSYILNSSQLIGGMNVTWNYYANDSFGNLYNNSWKTFYIRNRTFLIVNPPTPDGLNNWYITEPLFSLIKDPTGGNVSYRWDAIAPILYTAPFGLDNIPNPPKESAGILELNWWTDFNACGNELEQSQMFYIDLTDPLITNLQPANNSIVYNNLRPNISAYLDEVYGSNSGINLSKIIMKLDGGVVSANVNSTDKIDAIVSYIPTYDLELRRYNVTVNVTDNAGRNSELTWFFAINESPPFIMNVNSPQDGIYGNRRILFNISLNTTVKILEYINHNDTRPRWRRLCRNCDGYGTRRKSTKTLREGNNNITIRATDNFGNVNEKNISLFIDSRAPRIIRTLPKRNRVTNGTGFYIKYTEDNLKEVSVSWNPTVVLVDCNESGRNKECYIDLDLSAYNDNSIDYWFNVSDDIRSVNSRKISVLVDTIPPVINYLNYTIRRRRVTFNISITEKNFDVVKYIDYTDRRPRWRRLCSRLRDGICLKRRSFRTGFHNLTINITDKAGNYVSKENITFII